MYVFSCGAAGRVQARYLPDGRCRAARELRGPVTSGTPLMSWGGKQRGRYRTSGRARGPASAAVLAPGARRTWPLRYQSIDARRRRGRVAGAAHSCRANSWRPSPVNMNRDASPPPSAPLAQRPHPAPCAARPRTPLSWPTLRRALPNTYTIQRSAKYGGVFQREYFILQLFDEVGKNATGWQEFWCS